MQPILCDRNPITLLGLSFYGDPFDTHAGWDEDNQIGRLWKRLFALLPQSPAGKQVLENCQTTYEVHIHNPETAEKGYMEIFAGIEVNLSELPEIPVQFSLKILPATRYAVFTFQGEEIIADWEKVLSDWLSTSGYICPYPYNFQYYDKRFKGLNNLAESVLDVYIPIQAAV